MRILGLLAGDRNHVHFVPKQLYFICNQRDMAERSRFFLTNIAICNILIADCNMTAGEKIRHLRVIEGRLRGLDREMTQSELVAAIKKEMKKTISQPYL